MRLRIDRLLIVGVTMLSTALILAVVSTVAFAAGPNNGGRGSFGGMMGTNGGMMGGRGGNGGMMGGYGGWGKADPTAKPISIDQAAQSVDSYLGSRGDADLRIDEVIEFSNNFYANITENSTGVHAFELLVDKYSGSVFPEMGPNMMWNTEYGMMSGYGGMMGSGNMMGGYYGGTNQSGKMTVSPAQARQYAQTYLDQNNAGTKAGNADEFYGYYTLETEKDGKTTGMLSVNGYTGQVWYHSWHGDYVQTKELG
ncbi:MAG: hypothetical protein Q7O66_23860 [Dehalococcoidia bacterium]|nr:hypothetical protein [Dehalococcoidia bacterium]